MHPLLILTIVVVILVTVAYYLYQAWLATVAMLTSFVMWTLLDLFPFVSQWWWLILLTSMGLGVLQARTLLRKEPFVDFDGYPPALPPDFDVPLSADEDKIEELSRERFDLSRQLNSAQDALHDNKMKLKDLPRTKSGEVDFRFRPSKIVTKAVEEGEEFVEKATNRLDRLESRIDHLQSKPDRKIAEWRNDWKIYGSVKGLSAGSKSGGACGFVVYGLLLLWLGHQSIWPIAVSALTYVLLVGAYCGFKSGKYEELCAEVIKKVREDRALSNAKPIPAEFPSPASDLPRLES